MPPAYRRDLANIGLGGYAWRLWGSASFSMAGFMYASTLMRRIVPLGICPNGTIFYPIWGQLFGAGSSPMTVGISCKSLEVQTPGNRWFSYLVAVFLQVILFFRLDKRDVPYRTASGAPGFLR